MTGTCRGPAGGEGHNRVGLWRNPGISRLAVRAAAECCPCPQQATWRPPAFRGTRVCASSGTCAGGHPRASRGACRSGRSGGARTLPAWPAAVASGWGRRGHRPRPQWPPQPLEHVSGGGLKPARHPDLRAVGLGDRSQVWGHGRGSEPGAQEATPSLPGEQPPYSAPSLLRTEGGGGPRDTQSFLGRGDRGLGCRAPSGPAGKDAGGHRR